MAEAPGKRLTRKTAEIRARGAAAVESLPTAAELGGRTPEERRHILDELRLELYSITAVIADDTVHRAWRHRSSFPPFGLARSRFSEWRLLLASPSPYEEGSIDSFHALWKAFVDTTVFHLHELLTELRPSEKRWMLDRLPHMLALFRIDADKKTRDRLTDLPTFVYGGLQFGSSVCVQLAEVMARLLERYPDTTPRERAAVIERSIRPAYRLAAMGFDEALATYRALLSPDLATPPPGWMDTDRFVVQESIGEPRRIELRDEPESRPADGGGHRALGCPARISPTGGESAIATLWRWCAQLARETGLLDSRGTKARKQA